MTRKKSLRERSQEMSAMDVQTPGQVPFTEFGVQFIDLILSADMLYSKLKQAVPAYYPIAVNGISLGTAQINPGEPDLVSRDDCEIVYSSNLVIDLDLVGGFIKGAASVPLTITVMTFAPCTVLVHIDPLTADDIQFETADVLDILGSMNVLEAIGWAAGDFALPGLLADAINGQLEASLPERWVDMNAFVPESQIDGTPTPATDPNTDIVPVGANVTASGTLYPGEEHLYGLYLEEGMAVGLTAYVKPSEPFGNDVSLTLFAGSSDERSTWFNTGAVMGDDYLRIASADDENDPYILASATGTYEFGVTYPEYGDIALDYKIVQTRIVPDSKKLPAERICFGQFGVNFMNEAISPELLKQKIAAKVGAPQHLAPFSYDDAVVNVDVNITVPDVLPWPADTPDEEVGHAVELDVLLVLDIEGPSAVAQTWEIRATATLPFLIHATLNPVTIHLEVDKPQISILPRDVIFCRGSNFYDQEWIHDLLREQIEAQLSSQIAAELADPTSRTINIQAIVDQMKVPPPAPDARASAPPRPDQLRTVTPALKPGRDAYYKVSLAEGQVLRFDIDASIQPGKPFDWDAEASFAICDLMNGILYKEGLIVSAGGSEWTRTRVEYTAPAAGTYQYRVQTNPFDDQYDAIKFRLTPLDWLESVLPDQQGTIEAKSVDEQEGNYEAEEASSYPKPEGFDDPDTRPYPEFIEPEPESRWLPFEGERSLTVAASGNTRVFHFTQTCPSVQTMSENVDEYTVDGQCTLEDAAEQMQLDPCESCMEVMQAADARAQHAVETQDNPYQPLWWCEIGNARVEVYYDRIDLVIPSTQKEDGQIGTIAFADVSNVEKKSGHEVIVYESEEYWLDLPFPDEETKSDFLGWVNYFREG